MNKKSFILLPALGLILSGATMMTACDNNQGQQVDVIHVESVSLNKTTLEVEVDATESLTVTVTPNKAADKSVTWSSDHPEIAEVSDKGVVKGVAEGEATITVTTTDGGKKATCKVTVKAAGSAYGSKEKPLTVARALEIGATECKEKNDWSKSELWVEGYLTKNGTPKQNSETGAKYIQNLYLGDSADATASLWVYSADYTCNTPYQNDKVLVHGWLENYNGTLEMTAKDKINPVLDSITAVGTSTIEYTGENAEFVFDGAKVESAKNGSKVSFKVNATSGYEVDAVKVNSVVVEADANGVYEATVQGNTKIVVDTKVAGETILKATMQYTNSEVTGNMTATGNAAAVGLDASVFSVDASAGESGNLPGLNKAGNIRLYNAYKETVTDKTAGSSFTISSKKVTIKKIEVVLNSGTKAGLDKLSVKAGSTEITGKDGVYEIEASEVTLKNVAGGTASAQIWIDKIEISYVEKEAVPATGVTLNKSATEIKVGFDETLTAAVAPATATASVIWSSDATLVATVDANGKVVGVAAGTANIKAVADNNDNGIADEGEPEATCVVTVVAAATVNEVTAPEAGKTYKMGMKVDTKYYFATTGVDKYGAPNTTDDVDAALDVTTEAGVAAGTLKIKIGDKYLNAKVNGKYINLYLEDTCTSEFLTTCTVGEYTFNGLFVDSANCAVATAGEGSSLGMVYIGNYGTKTTFNTSKVSFLLSGGVPATNQWRAVFCTID